MLSEEMKKKLVGFLEEDHYLEDVTSEATPLRHATCLVVAHDAGTLAGVEEAVFLFSHVGVETRVLNEDGVAIEPGQSVLEAFGQNRAILRVERTVLNVLGRMSGVATRCRKMQERVGSKTTIALTRKTVPGFGVFDKKAAQIAGIWPHRLHLGQAVLLKENHLQFFTAIADAVTQARKKNGFVEVECETTDQVRQATQAKPDMILLDNFSVPNAEQAVAWLRKNAPEIKIELSGGITQENLDAYAALKPDYISMGALTKQAKTLDFSLDVVS